MKQANLINSLDSIINFQYKKKFSKFIIKKPYSICYITFVS